MSSTEAIGPTPDRFLLWPSALGLAGPMALGFASVYFDSLPILLAPFLVPMLIGVCLLAAAEAIRRAHGRRWRAAVSELMLSALLVGFAFAPNQLFGPVVRLGTEAGLVSYYGGLMPEILQTPREGGPRFLLFDRGGFGGISLFTIYDESDEIGLAPNERSPAWQAKHAGDAGLCDGAATHMIGHFYECATG